MVPMEKKKHNLRWNNICLSYWPNFCHFNKKKTFTEKQFSNILRCSLQYYKYFEMHVCTFKNMADLSYPYIAIRSSLQK